MKTKRILIIVAVVFALLFCACVGGLIYCGIMTSYTAYTDDNTYETIISSSLFQSKECR